MINWETQKLKDICIKIGSGATPRGGDSAYISEGISLIRSQNVLDFTFSKDGLAFIDEQQAKGLANVTVQVNDVLLNITGDSVARVCQVPDDVLPARVNQHVAILRADTKKLVPEFLKYALLAKPTKELLLTYASTGATRKALTKGMLEDFEINLPDLPTQQKIAEILSALDDKIELNRRMNQTLEQMAQTLFRQYFVDGIDADNLPEGWREGKLDEIVNVKGGTTPSTKQREFWDGDIHWTSPKDLSNLRVPVLLDTEKKITPAGLKKISSGLLPVGTLLLSSRAPIGYLALTQIPVAINQGYIAILGDKGYSNYFLLNWIKENMHIIIQNANGSTFLEISKSAFKNIDLAIPPVKTVSEFDEKVESLYKKMVLNEKEIAKLTIIRDTLLPKLMSGEIDVMQTQTAGQYEEVLS